MSLLNVMQLAFNPDSEKKEKKTLNLRSHDLFKIFKLLSIVVEYNKVY